MSVLPMFPLGTVLLPGEHLPLRIFEPRYLALVRDCMQDGRRFGIALIERGSDVGGGDSRFDVGCIARIIDVVRMPRGLLGLATVGTDRIRIAGWLEEAPYPRAEIEPFPDPPATDADRDTCEALAVRLRRVLAMAAEVGDQVAPATAVQPPGGPVEDSYALSALAPLGPLDRLALLRASTVAERLTLLTAMLEDVEGVLASRLGGG